MSKKIGFVETPNHIAKLMVELSTCPDEGNVLDTGCGRGVFLEELRKKGYSNCIGIEINEELYKYVLLKFKNDYGLILGDFLNYPFKEKFDLIIGNPPYVHFNDLPAEIANTVKNISKTGEGDIYYAFILKSISLLKEGGELIYIVPYHFFYNTYAKIVREKILKHGKIEIIIDLDEVPLFSNENPETVIFKFKKGKFNLNNEKIEVLNIKTRKTNELEIYEKAKDVLKNKMSNELFDYNVIPHYINSDIWSSFFIDIPKFPSVKLKNIAKVGVGLVSGFDKAFVLDEKINLNNEEKKLIKKFVKGKTCKRFIVDNGIQYILIEDSIKNEEELRRKYSNIYAKIVEHKDKMSDRYLPKNKKWFNWQALRNYKFLMKNLNKKRIYVPTLDRHPYNRFSLGNEGLLPSGDVLFIQPFNEEDLYFLLGYLNSTFFRKYYLANGGRRGGRVSFTQRLVENVEIPLFHKEIKDKIAKIALEIINKLNNGEDTTELNKDLDCIIYSAIENMKFDNTGIKIGYKSITLDNWYLPQTKI
ncbi:class I SAM-dependent DNA methyltransferase [Methanothermococcus sp.]|uniref:HsdM family class I SAM-dependent methyltransferase n=1 Tax=Methanothermococcus sp. TaxID=2614238 RepID=UPI0025DB7A79|nr:N-6 DNA methylase [Methanothermococcus sp.]